MNLFFLGLESGADGWCCKSWSRGGLQTIDCDFRTKVSMRYWNKKSLCPLPRYMRPDSFGSLVRLAVEAVSNDGHISLTCFIQVETEPPEDFGNDEIGLCVCKAASVIRVDIMLW